ncbi:MAG: hypothetical protein Q9P01_14645 [Anaerolineae bacterium]|nr:hypothetical protein [Anaerolineae bacterium]
MYIPESPYPVVHCQGDVDDVQKVGLLLPSGWGATNCRRYKSAMLPHYRG